MELKEMGLMKSNSFGMEKLRGETDSRKEVIIRAEVICQLVKFTFLHARSPYTDLYRQTIQLPSPLIHRGVPWPLLQTTWWGTEDAQDSVPCVLGK